MTQKEIELKTFEIIKEISRRNYSKPYNIKDVIAMMR